MSTVNTNIFSQFTDSNNNKTERKSENITEKMAENNIIQDPVKKQGFIDKFETGIKNSADLNDTVQVPRTIFKGYLAFIIGTALTTLGLFAKDKLKVGLNIASAALIVLGSFYFVSPYIFKSNGTQKS